MAEGNLEKLREVFIFASFVVGVAALFLTAYQAWVGNTKSAAALGILCAGCAAVVFLSQIKMLKFFEVQVELTQELDRAKELNAGLSRLAVTSAKATYLQMAYANRMGTPSVKVKQAILDETVGQLHDLKTSPAVVTQLQRPYVDMITLDFYFLYQSVLSQYGALRNNVLIERVNKNDTPENRAAREAHSVGITSWSRRTNDPDPFVRLVNSTLDIELTRVTPREDEWLNRRELDILNEFKATLVRLDTECRVKGGYTDRAAEYYDQRHDKAHDVAKDLFGPVLADLGR